MCVERKTANDRDRINELLHTITKNAMDRN
jgi:hypothetical protein